MKMNRILASYLLLTLCLISILPASICCSSTPSSGENLFVELLKMLPATDKEIGCFNLIDYQKIRQDNGLLLYDSQGQKVSRDDFIDNFLNTAKDNDIIGINALTLSSYYSGWGRFMITSPMQVKYIGYDLTYIDAEINTLNKPPEFIVAIIGRFDLQTTRTALSNSDEWPAWVKENYSIEEYQNIEINSWGDGIIEHFDSKLSPPHLDEFGRAPTLAVTEKSLFVGISSDAVKSMIDADNKMTPSLADVPEYVLAAKGMYDLGAYGAIIGDESLANGTLYDAEFDEGPRLNKFITFGTGTGRDKKGNYMALVLVHDNPTDAEGNVPLLEQRINTNFKKSDGISWSYSGYIYDTEIYTEDNVLLAKLYTNDEMLWCTWFYTQWALVLH